MADILYWHTRSTTIGISRFATILFAVISLGKYFLKNLSSTNLKEQLLITLFATLANLPLELSPFLMLKVIWRMEFGWNQKEGKGKWTENGKMKRSRCKVIPSVNFAKATHAERASDRLDARTAWTLKLSVSTTYYLLCSPGHKFSVVLTEHLFSSSLYHAALPISSCHPRLPSFSLHLSVSLVKLMNIRFSPPLSDQSSLRGSLSVLVSNFGLITNRVRSLGSINGMLLWMELI